ncbi:hypothetical protein GCM10022243_57920 [Saccharothrix violaceirubra]|uniref:Transcriptional regulator with XRE-family HTH domain n=1 Tax=Saccharothrix violaceirubra TaxID=413306 RepID=A0A7W7WWA2_9PSEU|nr:NB-ARC domain-containing protein [Saccharothrix violaceirubra]MBB4965777.1 transcriptional regulator with XRE-family HTH domain [Saccharothrix violaceirubra]
MNYFGAVLLRLRLDRGMTQEELAEKSGLSARAIGNMERGTVARPHRRSVDSLGAVLGDAALRALRAVAWTPQPLRQVPRQLPPDAESFVGRCAELRELATLVSPAPGRRLGPVVVSVSGVPGVGKTAFAVRACQVVGERFPDGQLFVNLQGGMAVDEVAARLLRGLGITGDGLPADIDERAALLRSTLHDRRFVLVLDGVVDERQIRALLPNSAHCLVILTSRRTLTGLNVAKRVVLGALDLGTGLDMLRSTLGPDVVDAQSGAAAEVVRLCGGHPLALRIMINQLASRPHWCLAQLAARLRPESDRLAQLEVGDLSMRAALESVYRQLSVPAATLLLGVARAPGVELTVGLAETLLAGGPLVALRAVDELVDANLVVATGRSRWSLPDLVRLFGREVAGHARWRDRRDHRSVR